jgi:hypothetical protein
MRWQTRELCCGQSTHLVDPAWARAIRERLTDRFVLIARRVNNAQKVISDEVFSKGLRQLRNVSKKRSCRDGIERQQQAGRAKCRAGGRMGTRARLTRKKLGAKTTHRMIIRSRDSSNHGTNKIVPVDMRTRKELRKMQFVRYDALFCFGLKRAQRKRTSGNEKSRDRGEEKPRNGTSSVRA